MFANNPMGLVVKGMMEELREEGEIPSSGWQDRLRESAAKVVHAFGNGRVKEREQKADAQPSELQPCETCS